VPNPKVVDLTVSSEFHIWISDFYNPPDWDDDVLDLYLAPLSPNEETRRQTFLGTEFAGTQLSVQGISWIIVEAGIPYEYRIGDYLIHAYVDCLAQQVKVGDELDSEGNAVVHKLDNWRVMNIDISDEPANDLQLASAVTFSNILAIAQLRDISSSLISGGVYISKTGEFIETVQGMQINQLTKLLNDLLEKQS
jgi:hypothetical protein